MTAAKKQDLVSVEEYLAAEMTSPIKHEYIGGVVHAMAGARNEHNHIVLNIVTALKIRLRGKPCQPWNSDTKIRIRLPSQFRFYYADASVICEPNDRKIAYQDKPVVVVEVLSRSTRRLDLGEKKDAYSSIPSLQVYLVVEQESAKVVAFRRSGASFVREVYEGEDALVPLSEIGTDLPLAEIYDEASFAIEVDDAE